MRVVERAADFAPALTSARQEAASAFGDDRVFFEMQVGLLGVEREFRGMSRRAGIFDELEKRLRTGLYGSEEEAVAVLTERKIKSEPTRQLDVYRTSLPVVEGTRPKAEEEE